MSQSVYMEDLTRPLYEERVRKSVVILPIGATEQHGEHLPLGTDSLQSRLTVEAVAKETGSLVAHNCGFSGRARDGFIRD